MRAKREYFESTKTGWQPTKLRPSAEEKKAISASLKADRKYVHLHEPGAGWHMLPTLIQYLRGPNGAWSAMYDSSESAVLAHVEDISQAIGVPWEDLLKQAFGDDGTQWTADHAACKVSATVEDFQKVLDDLEDINYHTFSDLWEKAVREALATLQSRVVEQWSSQTEAEIY